MAGSKVKASVKIKNKTATKAAKRAKASKAGRTGAASGPRPTANGPSGHAGPMGRPKPAKAAASTSTASGGDEDDDDDIELDEEDRAFLEEYKDYASFLANLDEKELTQYANAPQRTTVLAPDATIRQAKNAASALLDGKRKRPQGAGRGGDDEDDDEEAVEKRPRSFASAEHGAGAKGRLPVKGQDGVLRAPMRELEKPELAPAAAAAAAPEAADGDDEEIFDDSDDEAGDEAAVDGDGEEGDEEDAELPWDREVAGAAPRTAAQLAAHREECKVALASVATDLLEDPETKIGLLHKLLELTRDRDVVVQRLALLTLLAVYKDIIPGYRIRKLTEAEMAEKVSKDVKRIRKFEQSLLTHYQLFLKHLDKILHTYRKALRKHKLPKDCPWTLQELEDNATLATEAMCELLVTKPFFNFTTNVLNALVPCLALAPSSKIHQRVCASIHELFKGDEHGAVSLEAVEIITRFVRTRNYHLPASALETFLSLRLITELNPDAFKGTDNGTKPGSAKNKKKGVHESRKLRKMNKEERELQKALEEAEAVHSKAERERLHTETLKLVFHCYFRILKNMQRTPLLLAVLKGLGRFTHLISVDFFTDLLAVLKQLAYAHVLDVEGSLQCVLTTLQLASGQGEALNLDLKDFSTLLYSLLLDLSADGGKNVPVALAAVEAMLLKRKQYAETRVAAFVKRLAMQLLQVPSNGALASLITAHTMLQRYPRTQIMLDSEQTALGKYLPDSPDPDACQPLAAGLWELALLRRHYHPTVAKLAGRVASGDAGIVDKPQAVWRQFDPSLGAFHPAVKPPNAHPLAKRPPGTAFVRPPQYFEGKPRFLQSVEATVSALAALPFQHQVA